MNRIFGKYVLLGAAAMVSASGIAHASTVTGTAYCDISSAYAANAPTLSQLSNAESTSAGTCATFTASAINFASGTDGAPGNDGSLNAFLNYQGGNLLSSNYYALAAANVSAGGVATTNTGSQSQDGTLFVLTGSTYLTTGESITLSHDDGALLYFNGLLVSNQGAQTVDGQNPFIYDGSEGTGAGTFTLIYTSNYLPPADLQSNINLTATPEPNSMILLGTGMCSAAGMVLRRRRKTA